MRPRRPARRLAAPLVVMLALPGLASPARAEAFVSVSATRQGDMVEVQGSASLPDSPFVEVGQDAAGDVSNPAGGLLAGDLKAISLATRSDGSLAVRWSVVSLPSNPRELAGVARFRFSVNGVAHEIAAARSDATGFDGCTNNNFPCRGGWLVRCGTSGCAWTPQGANGGATLLSRDVTVSIDAPGNSLQAVVPSGVGGVFVPGSTVGPLAGTAAEASTSLGQLELSADVDTGEMTEPYTYGLRVWLATADPAADATSLEYAAPATVAADNFRFSASLPVPAGQAVFAKACLGGPANCAYGRSDTV